MKKAVILGGSSGIGLSLCKSLAEKGYFIYILSRSKPDSDSLSEGVFCHLPFDCLDYQEDIIESLASDPDVELLFLSAGIGRIADFQFYHIAEIEKTFSIDSLAFIKTLRIFYPRILSDAPFYTGVMGSIAGWMSSPSASVYAAAKAAVVRFVESVNIELEAYGSRNRILDVSPAYVPGTRFYGGSNDLSALQNLSEDILVHLFSRDTRFIPKYEETFKAVLERYHTDAHEYGLHSYHFKKESGRLDNQRRVIIGYLSGTFDLFHIGHLNLLKRAKAQCDYLIVGVHNSGKWKGKETYVPFEERKAILAACKYVDKVVTSCPEDSDAWLLWHYDKLFVGSDYKGSERFQRYEDFFADKNVQIVYFPYTQSTSSTQLRQAIALSTEAKADPSGKRPSL